jgi:bifunctional DNA-binding transcriptional regulator/antitoxin component of YhaV-PrlF toxin-antitoxin module
MVIPARARKEAGLSQGDVFSVQIQGDGRILLARLEKPGEPGLAKARLLRRKGTHPVLVGARKPTDEGILLKPVTTAMVKRGFGLLKRKHGDRPLAEEWAEHKREEREREEAKYGRHGPR